MFGAGELSPFNDNFQPIDPFAAFASINRPLRRMERRMERERGKMLSGIHEVDKSFEVSFILFSLFTFLTDFIFIEMIVTCSGRCGRFSFPTEWNHCQDDW